MEKSPSALYRDAMFEYFRRYRQACEVLDIQAEEPPDDATEEAFEAFYEQEARVTQEFRVPEARKALQEAEEALISWGLAQMSEENRAIVEPLVRGRATFRIQFLTSLARLP